MGSEVARARLAERPEQEPPHPVVEAPAPEAPVPVRRLQVGAVGDPAEAAADRAAAQALARLHLDHVPHEADAAPAPVRRSVVPGAGPEGGALDERTAARITSRTGGGSPMDEPVRRRMESAFGRSFSSVRVHDDSDAADLSSAISARAFTSGSDVFLGTGVDTSTAAGEQVLAHELAHVVQNGSRPAAPIHRWFGKSKSKKPEPPKVQGGGNRDAIVLGEDTKSGGGGFGDKPRPSGTRPRSGPTIGGNRGSSGGGKLAEDDLILVLEDEPEKDAPKSGGGEKAPEQTGQEGLTEDAKKAFEAAKRYNNLTYSGYEPMVSTWVKQSQQKQIMDVSSWSKRAGGDGDKRNLKDLLRAFLLGQYVAIIGTKLDKPNITQNGDPRAPKPSEWKLFQEKYLPKTLRSRDKWKGLIDRGPYAPETQTWLLDAGFQAAIPRTPDQLAEDGGGPRIDVRSTFIGSDVLGAPRRMHLFIVYTSARGQQVYFRGGPSGGQGGDLGFTRCDSGVYDSSTVDWDPSAPSVTVAAGDEARDALDSLYRTASQITAMKVPYSSNTFQPNKGGLGGLEALLTGENCNTSVWTLLEMARLPKKKPSGVHPGWGHKIGAISAPEKVGHLVGYDDNDNDTRALVAGAPDTTKNLFHDRGLKEKVDIVQGGSEIVVLKSVGSAYRVRRGMTIAYILKSNVVIPPPVVVKKYWTRVGGSVRVNGGGVAMIDAGQPVKVVTKDWVPGTEGDVEITWTEGDNLSFTGKVDGAKVTDQDPNGPPKVDDLVLEQVTDEPDVKKDESVDDEVVDPRFEDRDVDSDDESSDEDLKDIPDDESDRKPVIQEFLATRSVELYNKDGSRRGTAWPKIGQKVGATGVQHKLPLGKVMVQFVVDGEYAWIEQKKWIKLTRKPYPGT